MMLGAVNSLLLYKVITLSSLFVSPLYQMNSPEEGVTNNLLTQNKVFVETLKENINEWASVSNEQQDPRVDWEFLKHKIFRFSEQYANAQSEKRKAKRVSLEENGSTIRKADSRL